jgi:ubiquinone/menaquinone biosynthesis C-methylase UbiE
MSTEVKATETAKKRYNRIAPLYDLVDGLMERFFHDKWRKLLWSKVEGIHILEVGVGTGKNFPYYPADAEITAIDFSEKMLRRAEDKVNKQKARVHLMYMDVQNLEFEDNTFDTAVASFVFCSVPDPVRGLMEIERVCKPEGKVVLLEHVQSANRIVGWLMNLSNPLVARIMGSNINRLTENNVVKSGLVVEQVTDLGTGIIKLIEARKRSIPAV